MHFSVITKMRSIRLMDKYYGNNEKMTTDLKMERWRYPRFFSECFPRETKIYGDDAKHISVVLRMRAGQCVVICDGNGKDFLCEITDIKNTEVNLKIIDSKKNLAEPDVKIRLFQCVPKSDKLEFITQKATELGVSEIIPVISARCVSRPDDKSRQKKTERLRKIAAEAAKQSGRGRIPLIHDFINFNETFQKWNLNISEKINQMGIIFYECGGKNLKNLDFTLTQSIDIFIGSEGGFLEEEVLFAQQHGFHVATLGNRILRTETAPIAALAILMNICEKI